MGRGRSVDFELCLAPDFIHWCLVGQFRHELIRLDIDVLLAWRCLWGLDVACEEFFGSLGSLLLETFWVVLAFVCLEKLVRVGAGRDDHRRVGAPSEHALVMHNVLRVVGILVNVSIGVLILLLL